MNKRAFEQLYQRYLRGECSAEEILLIEHWFENIKPDPCLSLADREKEVLEEELLDRILRQTQQPNGSVFAHSFTGSRHHRFFYSKIAASVLLLLTLAWYGWNTSSKPPIQPVTPFGTSSGQLRQTNTLAEAQTIILEDGSKVTLTPGSSITYARHSSPDNRKVQLQGDAFFEIVKDPKKPFFVYSGQIVARVLGTSFWVKTQAHSKAIKVEVKTGRVSVYENQCQADPPTPGNKTKVINGIVLTPNQQATFFAEEQHLVAGLVDNPLIINPPVSPTRLIYEETPLPQVLKDLEAVYAIKLVMANDNLKTCTVMGDLNGMSLYQQLDMICKATKASYEVKGTHIVISGNGCE